MQPPSSVWWNLLVHCPSLAALIVRCQLWQVGRLQVAISHSVPCTSKIKCLWLSAAPECNWCRKLGSMKEPIHTAHHSPTTWSSVVIDACLIVYGVCLSSVSGRATSVYLCHYLDCTVCMCYVCWAVALSNVQVLQRALWRGQSAMLWRPWVVRYLHSRQSRVSPQEELLNPTWRRRGALDGA